MKAPIRDIPKAIVFTILCGLPGLMSLFALYVLYMLFEPKIYSLEPLFYFLLGNLVIAVVSAPFVYFKATNRRKFYILLVISPIVIYAAGALIYVRIRLTQG